MPPPNNGPPGQPTEGGPQSILPLHRSLNSARWSTHLAEEFEEALSALIEGKTPKMAIYTRKGRGTRNFQYVKGYWVVHQLNHLFDYNWDWEILHQQVGKTQVWVQGKLTVRTTALDGRITTIIKTSYGGSDIKTYAGENARLGEVIDLADDLKAASTDALKKAASFLGIASDVYWSEDSGSSGDEVPESTLRALYMRGGTIGWSEEETRKWASTEGGCSFEELTSSQVNNLLGKLVMKARTAPNGREVKEKVQ